MDIEAYQHKKLSTAGDSNSKIDQMIVGKCCTHPHPVVFTFAIVAIVALLVGTIVAIVVVK